MLAPMTPESRVLDQTGADGNRWRAQLSKRMLKASRSSQEELTHGSPQFPELNVRRVTQES